MSKINVLKKNVYEKIAAGEVIERPGAVVKELVENAIDAGATYIMVDIRGGGLERIRVSDNGSGMDEADAQNAFLPHATSKISEEADLYSISSLGFRGEALASISAVSEVTLSTRAENAESGVAVTHRAGELISVKPAGCPEGTSVTINSLFYNMPARLKFMKKPSVEAGYISDLMQRFILSRPGISFNFKSDGQTIYHSPGTNDPQKAIWAVYGAEARGQLKRVEYAAGDIRIFGYVGTAELSRANRSRQTLFINHRYVRDAGVSNVVQKAYGNTLMAGRFPFFVLNLDVPYAKTDVNVHPNKMEVRFTNEREVLEAFFSAVQNALFNRPAAKEEAPPVPPPPPTEAIPERPVEPSPTPAPEHLKYEDTPIRTKIIDVISRDTKLGHSLKEAALVYETEQTAFIARNYDYRLLGNLFKTYVLLEADERFIIIDQHAAHERLRYDALKTSVERGEPASQLLMMPYVFDVNLLEKQVILGFDIELFGNLTFRVSAVPHILGEPQIKRFFTDVLDNLNTLKSPKVELKREALMQWACKHSVRAGDMLSSEEIIYLLRASAENTSPLVCPHGRPIMRQYSRRDLEKMFKRAL